MIMSLSPNFPSTNSSSTACTMMLGSNLEKKTKTSAVCLEGTKERIKKMFDKVELSVSPYDTAWVAMVPSPNYPQAPFFPQCINWLLENQLYDGSWASVRDNPLLMKDTLLSTLACILSLKQWGVGEQQINKGVQFIKSNFDSVSDDKQHSPIGFDIIFPSLIEYVESLGLNLPIGSTGRDAIMKKRELLLKGGYEKNSEGWRAYLAYISEGMGTSQDWEAVMKYQRKNGSLFNSPATTAAAFTNLKHPGCLNYLLSLIEKFGNAAPAVYPLHIYCHLCMVDILEQLGINHHFREEIRSVLDETYRYWLQGEEDIFLDPATCAMAFRMLRINGYGVSSDPLTQHAEDKFSNSLQGYLLDGDATLELYRASQLIINPDELVLEKLNSWTRQLLVKESLYQTLAGKLHRYVGNEVIGDLIEFPYHTRLERISHRRAIEHHVNIDRTKILKTSFSSPNLGNEEFLRLAVEDFNTCQLIHHEEFKQYTRWFEEGGLGKLKLQRQKPAYCYFTAALVLPPPEYSDARISWAKNAVLTAVGDDFFDYGGSVEEHINLTQLVEKWDVDVRTDCCSELVKIIFSGIKSTVLEVGERAAIHQGRNVTSHLIKIWLDLIRSNMQELHWYRTKYVPTVEEYLENGYISFALGPIVLPALYFIGPVISKETVESPEYNNLFKLMGICCRLLNDFHGAERESAEGKYTAVTLRVIHGNGAVTEKEAINEMRRLFESKLRELLRLVYQEKGGSVPRVCRDLFWKIVKVCLLFYHKDDGFHSSEIVKIINEMNQVPFTLDK